MPEIRRRSSREKRVEYMSGVRPVIAKSVVAAAFFIFSISQAHALAAPVRYACPASENLTVKRNLAAARVTLAGRTYDLQRKQSSIGVKYLSANAALIIDGASAVFVADDHLDLGTCVRALPVASAR